MPNKKSVLVTGLSGAVGQAINGFIKDRYEISSLSRNGVKNIPKQNNHKGDIGSLDSIIQSFDGVDTVVHLAADGGVRSINGMNADWNSILQSNIIGTHNVFREYVTVSRGTTGGNGLTRIGNHNLFMAHSHVGHDGTVGSHCVLANSVALAGHVVIEDHAVLGGLAGVHQNGRIGCYAMLGAGAMAALFAFGVIG